VLPKRIDPRDMTIWLSEKDASGRSRNVVRESARGREVRPLPDGQIYPDGTVVGCRSLRIDPPEFQFVIFDGATGAERFALGTTYTTCPTDMTDLSGRYITLMNSASSYSNDSFTLTSIVDLQTGQIFVGETGQHKGAGAVFVRPTPDGPEQFVFSKGGTTRYLPARRVTDFNQFAGGRHAVVWGEDARHIAQHRTDATTGKPYLDVVQTVPQEQPLGRIELESRPGGTDLAPIEGQQTTALSVMFTAEDRYLVIHQGQELRVYSTDNLSLVRRIELPVPPELGAGGPWSISISSVTDDEIAVLYGGLVTRWRLTDGQRIGEPLALWQDAKQLQALATLSRAGIRDDTGEFVVATREFVAVWNLAERRLVRTIGSDPFDLPASLHFQPDLSYLYVATKSGSRQRWNIETGQILRTTQPMPWPADFFGVSSGGLIIVERLEDEIIEVWGAERGRILQFDPPGKRIDVSVQGDALYVLTTEGLLRMNLDRATLQERLCALSNRAYTEAERGLLPPGADTTPPCSQS
jgi:hypothetical protein